MADRNTERPGETLDPDDWQALRQLGHRMIDDTMDYLEHIRSRPVWQPVPPSIITSLIQPLTRDPQGEESVY